MYVDVRFVKIPDNKTTAGTLRFTKTDNAPVSEDAHAYFPGGAAVNGDVWINANALNMDDLAPRSIGFGTILHEIGHALGLKHPFEGRNQLPDALDNKDNTIMSYDPGHFVGLSPLSPMPFDVRALQYLYGANERFNTGNDVYTEARLAKMFGANGLHSPTTGYPTATLWDAGGIDTIVALGPRIDLRTAEPDYLNGTITRVGGYELVIARGAVIENATALDVGAQIIGNSADNVLKGDSGTTSYYDYAGAVIMGLGGTDTLHADRAVTPDGENSGLPPGFLYGGGGNDALHGYQNPDVLEGGSGNDRLYGRAGDDTLNGGSGNDYLNPGTGADRVVGGADIDTIDFSEAAGGVVLTLMRGGGPQTVFVDGRAGASVEGVENIVGSSHADVLAGDSGNNLLNGRGGQDWLTGGKGADRFVFDRAPGESNVDHIADFHRGQGDLIQLDDAVFAKLDPGRLARTDFATIPSADASVGTGGHVLFDRGTGGLFYDPNGGSAAGRVQVAVIDNGAELTHRDVLII